jgi:hypothetical protein
MELFIRIKDGQPFEHPIMENNFREAFPEVDTNNLPAEFARFVRIEPPTVGPYEKSRTVSYQLVNGMYTDVYVCEQLSEAHIAIKQQGTKNMWAANNGFASWVFNEATCDFEAPVPKPNDGKFYRWNEPTTSWIEVTNV